MKSSLRYEIDNYSSGTLIAGFDEVGRGAIAGPIVVASVILKPNFNHPLIKDSKQLSAKQRIAMYQIIIDNALTVVVSIKSHQFVNIHNPKQTSILAMIEAFNFIRSELILWKKINEKICQDKSCIRKRQKEILTKD
ncbi:hypothetical protein [Spiroplasma endosymbiont of Cleonymus obscurus]|uniref:hypothetical protein n=1 Tax=Spiroplasma endosymbiont of Cleonymus obscurus TaxID=3066324 RepID=UPI0037DCF8D8